MTRHPAKWRPSVDDVVCVRFLDHAMGTDAAIEFLVWGRIAIVTRTTYVVRTWDYVNAAVPDHNPDNVERFSIVRKAILEMWKLESAV